MKIGPLLVVGAAGVCCTMALGSLVWQGTLPYKGYSESSRIVVIPEGKSARYAAARLAEARVIRSAFVFRVLMRLRGAEGRIHSGEYQFSGDMSPDQVLDKLLRGEVVQHRVTIPEGLRLDEVADLLAPTKLVTREKFLAAASSAHPIADLDPQARDLEGYLFPDTYLFPRDITAERVVEEMVGRFRRELTPIRMARLQELGLTLRQAVSLASLVEEEAHLDEERPRIAAVFHNRLRTRMLLQCDPTVVYALVRDNRYRGEIYRSDLRYRSPYNTYLNPGLPPGPICSPGLRSLEAALYPATTSDLYFVVSGPGRHRFSTRFEDHEEAVRQYRRGVNHTTRRD